MKLGALLRHLAFEEDRAAAPLRLGAIHREIRLADDVLEIDAVVGEQRDADAGAHLVIAAAEIRRQRERADHAIGDLPRGLGIADIAQQHREFIAAEPRDRVALFRAGLEAVRDDRQQLVARAVAERVVDALEVIEIDVHERAAREAGGGAGEFLRQPVAEQRAVRQLRERVVVRLAIEPLVARAVRQRRTQPLGERRAVVGDRGIARGLAVISHDEHGGEPVFVDHRPQPEELGARVAHGREERVPRLLDARDRHAFGRLAHRGDHRRNRRSRVAPAAHRRRAPP